MLSCYYQKYIIGVSLSKPRTLVFNVEFYLCVYVCECTVILHTIVVTLHTKHCSLKISDTWSQVLQARMRNEAEKLLKVPETTAQSNKTRKWEKLYLCGNLWIQLATPQIACHQQPLILLLLSIN